MQGWRITSRRKQTTRIETRRQKPPLQSLFFFFRSQQKIGFLCAKMKAGTVVLFTLFFPVLAGPPVEAAESGFPSFSKFLAQEPHDTAKSYEQYLQYLQYNNFPGVPYRRIRSEDQYSRHYRYIVQFPYDTYGRRIWHSLYDWYEALTNAKAEFYSPFYCRTGSSGSFQDYLLQLNSGRMEDFEATYEIKLEDLHKLGELKEEHDHLKTEKFREFLSNFKEFRGFINNFIDNEFEEFLKRYTREAKATVKAMKAIKEKMAPMDSLDNSLDTLALDTPMDSLDTLDNSLDTLALDTPMAPMAPMDSISLGQTIWHTLYGWYDVTHEGAYTWYDHVVHEAAAIDSPNSHFVPTTGRFDILRNKKEMETFEGNFKIKLEDLLELGELKEQHYQLGAEEFKDFITHNFEKFKDFINNFEGDDFKIFFIRYNHKEKATVKVMKAMKEKTLNCLAQALDSLAQTHSHSPNCDKALDCVAGVAYHNDYRDPHSYSDSHALAHALGVAVDSMDSALDAPMALALDAPNSLAVESTKRQRSIIFGLTTLTIFSGLALLLFWILEEQKKKSRANIKA